MNRRSFLSLSPAFPVAAVSASLTLKAEGQEPVELDVSVLKLQAGDTLVFKTKSDVSYPIRVEMCDVVRHRFPGVEVLILDDDLTLEGVLRGPDV